MSASRLAIAAAIAGAALWGAKAVAIAVAGGLDKSPLESPLFVLGLIAILVAAAAIGFVVAGPRALWLRAAAAAAALALGVVLVIVIQAIIGGLIQEDAGWVREEAGLWVSSALVVGIALVATRPRPAEQRW